MRHQPYCTTSKLSSVKTGVTRQIHNTREVIHLIRNWNTLVLGNRNLPRRRLIVTEVLNIPLRFKNSLASSSVQYLVLVVNDEPRSLLGKMRTISTPCVYLSSSPRPNWSLDFFYYGPQRHKVHISFTIPAEDHSRRPSVPIWSPCLSVASASPVFTPSAATKSIWARWCCLALKMAHSLTFITS